MPHYMEPQELALATAKDFAWVYLRLNRLIGRELSGSAASQAQMKLLAFLQDGGKRSTDIAGYFGHSPRTVTQAIDALEKCGFVTRSALPGDRRAKLIEITDRGRAALLEVQPLYQAVLANAFGSLDGEELGDLERLLGRLLKRISELESA